jgi:hypothetical protein
MMGYVRSDVSDEIASPTENARDRRDDCARARRRSIDASIDARGERRQMRAISS